MLRYAALAIAGLILTGCVTAEEQRAIDQDKCASFGFTAGTDAFANCMMTQSAQRADLDQREMESNRSKVVVVEDRRDRRRSSDDYIDSTPQFDRDGNPNFDESGGYIGCHGVGCMVDNPDDGDSGDDD